MKGEKRDIIRRRPRFSRTASATLRLTRDDLAIASALGRHRFLRSTHIVRLLAHRSPRKLLERLAELYHAGFLDRPRAQINYHAQSGSAPIVYALGNKGAGVFAELEHQPAPINDWTDKNRNAKRPYIEHALLLADLMLPLELARPRQRALTVVNEHTLLDSLPSHARRALNPWAINTKVHDGRWLHSAPVVPDAVFAVDFGEPGRRSYFFVEADRATMPVWRTNLTLSSFRRKFLAYIAARKADLFKQQLGFANLRVLTVTTTVERIATMLDALREVTTGRGSGMFLFIDLQTLSSAPDPLMAPWQTTAGVTRINEPPRV